VASGGAASPVGGGGGARAPGVQAPEPAPRRRLLPVPPQGERRISTSSRITPISAGESLGDDTSPRVSVRAGGEGPEAAAWRRARRGP
jgi:hypothetical protein